jgi:hypothetical protein
MILRHLISTHVILSRASRSNIFTVISLSLWLLSLRLHGVTTQMKVLYTILYCTFYLYYIYHKSSIIFSNISVSLFISHDSEFLTVFPSVNKHSSPLLLFDVSSIPLPLFHIVHVSAFPFNYFVEGNGIPAGPRSFVMIIPQRWPLGTGGNHERNIP